MPFNVVQGHCFRYQWKARIRLPINEPLPIASQLHSNTHSYRTDTSDSVAESQALIELSKV